MSDEKLAYYNITGVLLGNLIKSNKFITNLKLTGL